MYGVCLELSIVHLVVHILFIPSALMIVLVALSLASSTRTIKKQSTEGWSWRLRRRWPEMVAMTPLGHWRCVKG